MVDLAELLDTVRGWAEEAQEDVFHLDRRRHGIAQLQVDDVLKLRVGALAARAELVKPLQRRHIYVVLV